jgi:hypothetical protein
LQQDVFHRSHLLREWICVSERTMAKARGGVITASRSSGAPLARLCTFLLAAMR